jgi:aminoglycoside phosphotransferase (APT) family kinase protein
MASGAREPREVSGLAPPSAWRRARLRPPPKQALAWIRRALGRGSRIARVRALRDGGWHANHAIDVIDARGRLHRLVLRRWARPGWEQDDPDFTVEREEAALALLASSVVPTPRVVATDPRGELCGVPAMLITRLAGHPPGEPGNMRFFVAQLARALVEIHAVDDADGSRVPAYRTYHDLASIEAPAWLGPGETWTRAFEVVRRPPPQTHTCFIHRDYHHNNTLWSRGQLTGVVDWTQASHGSSSVDLGHMRWNLGLEYGPRSADEFLQSYREMSGEGATYHPYWDVVTVLDLVADVDPADPLDGSSQHRLENYLNGVLAQL